MNFTYIFRAILWMLELSKTLLVFWFKNPLETPAVFSFIIKKGLALPKFLSRNVLTEKHSKSFEESLDHTAQLYKKYSKDFDPRKPASYKKLENVLESKSQILYFLVRKIKPQIAIETGVAAGESTGFILKAIQDNGSGKLYSVDLPFQWYIYGNHELHLDSLPAGKMSGYLVPQYLRTNWKLILGDTYEKLPPLLEKVKTIDIFLHDSEHTDKTMTFEYNLAWPHIQKKGFLLSDDVSFTPAFGNFTTKHKLTKSIFKDLGVTFKK